MLIMLIDEDSEDRDFFQEGLLEYNPQINFVYARNNKEAITILNELQDPPDFIFLDINMSGPKAKELLEKLKWNAQLILIPLIVYSVTRYITDIEESRDMGADYFMTKPSHMEELVSAFHFIFNNEEEKVLKDTLIFLHH